MFKWMISGHRGNRNKLNKHNSSSVKNNKNQLNQNPTQPSLNHYSTTVSNHNEGNLSNAVDFDGDSRSHSTSTLPHPPTHPPTHPPPPIPNNNSAYESFYEESHKDDRPKAPGTCTLPRRGMVRDDPSVRLRSPSNPPPASRQPPPYSRHQPPNPFPPDTKIGPYQPPPPPKLDPREPRDQVEANEARGNKCVWEKQNNSVVPRKDPSKQWGSQTNVSARTPETRRQNWQTTTGISGSRGEIQLETNLPKNDDINISSLPRAAYEAWLSHNASWQTKEMDSGFDSLISRGGEAMLRMEDETSTEQLYSKSSTEDLLNMPSSSPQSVSSCLTDTDESLMQNKKYIENNSHLAKYTMHVAETKSSAHLHESRPMTRPSQSPRNERAASSSTTLVIKSPQIGRADAIMSDSVYPSYDLRHCYEQLAFRKNDQQPKVSDNNRQLNYLQTFKSGKNNREAHNEEKGGTLPREKNKLARNSSVEKLVIVEDRERIEIPDRKHLDQQSSNPHQRTWESDRDAKSKELATFDTSQRLQVHNSPMHKRQQRIVDGADSLRVSEERRAIEPAQESTKINSNIDANASSVSWMEWTQQLQAYVAWVNSQLRKRTGRPLITDLRRDLQNGVVFADLIEIISNERVAGIMRDPDSIQNMRENLERILQFMAAKRIRMTHITSKEVAEGNLKSIMRIILALAAHYKPQSVSSVSSPQVQDQSASSKPIPSTHDVGVGPDTPINCAPEKTPNLSAYRHSIVTNANCAEVTEVKSLRRNPSISGPTSGPKDSSPLYENLPRRVVPNRWAYDSLRPSHKFQWNASSGTRGAPPIPPKAVHVSSPSNETLNSSFTGSLNTSVTSSLNTSFDGDGSPGSPTAAENKSSRAITSNSRPAAMHFWQELQTSRPDEPTKNAPPPPPPASVSPAESDCPFRYNTVHRLSGRRKLPQIPGQSATASPTMRRTTPIHESPVVPSTPPCVDNERAKCSTSSFEEDGSREPEGRSQNSSPATSLILGPTLEHWAKEKLNLSQWAEEDLKNVLRDLHATREQLLSLQKLEQEISCKGGLSSLESSALKQELLRLTLARQTLQVEKTELERQLEHREGIIVELRKQLQYKEKALQVVTSKMEEKLLMSPQIGQRKLNGRNELLNNRILASREEMQLVRDAISSLRNTFRSTDPSQHILDTLEQAISILTERWSASTPVHQPISIIDGKASEKRSCINEPLDNVTKVIYFMDRTVTPFMSSINKRLNDISLRDFKNMFDRPGNFRFHFKAHDPEYGLVKEEVLDDDDILPGVEGKIIAWVEEDNE